MQISKIWNHPGISYLEPPYTSPVGTRDVNGWTLWRADFWRLDSVDIAAAGYLAAVAGGDGKLPEVTESCRSSRKEVPATDKLSIHEAQVSCNQVRATRQVGMEKS